MTKTAWILGALFLTLTTSLDAQVTVLGKVAFEGDLKQPEQLSGIAFFHDLLLVCPDEKARLNVLRRVSGDRFERLATPSLLPDNDAEIDMEGLASDSSHVYVVGSHSLARKKAEAERSYEKNRERLTDVKQDDTRDSLFQIKLDAAGKIGSSKRINLRERLRADKILGPFTALPSKENGVDIEGIAVQGKVLYLGFRGPVLRENYVPIMTLEFEKPTKYQLLFVDLGGRGIRDIAIVANGFLLLGGPVGDGVGTYELYFWNGKDCIPGSGAPGGTVVSLGQVPAHGDSKPEGITVSGETSGAWRLILVEDGFNAGSLLSVQKPN